MGFKPPLSRGIIKKFFLISSSVLLRRSQSKIVRLSVSALSVRLSAHAEVLSKGHAEVQNPKSKIEMTILEACSITKHFPGVVANDSVNFSVERGEIHVLLGENGAG